MKRLLRPYRLGRAILTHPHYRAVHERQERERAKRPMRTEVINHLLDYLDRETCYLEIGVRRPADNFDHIRAATKYSVDPGLEDATAPVDFALTSDAFFAELDAGRILAPDIRFDAIFIDGLHLAEQVDRDIRNALNYVTDDGFVVLHDCNPPSEWHARTNYGYHHSPAGGMWTGTTWKAFVKWRSEPALQSCCVDTDWGIGLLSKTQPLGDAIVLSNPFYEYERLDRDRVRQLGLISFAELLERLHRRPRPNEKTLK